MKHAFSVLIWILKLKCNQGRPSRVISTCFLIVGFKKKVQPCLAFALEFRVRNILPCTQETPENIKKKRVHLSPDKI